MRGRKPPGGPPDTAVPADGKLPGAAQLRAAVLPPARCMGLSGGGQTAGRTAQQAPHRSEFLASGQDSANPGRILGHGPQRPARPAATTPRRSPWPATSACPSRKRALEGIGRSHLQDGNPGEATARLRHALAIYRRTGNVRARHLEETLRRIGYRGTLMHRQRSAWTSASAAFHAQRSG